MAVISGHMVASRIETQWATPLRVCAKPSVNRFCGRPSGRNYGCSTCPLEVPGHRPKPGLHTDTFSPVSRNSSAVTRDFHTVSCAALYPAILKRQLALQTGAKNRRSASLHGHPWREAVRRIFSPPCHSPNFVKAGTLRCTAHEPKITVAVFSTSA